MITKFFNGKYFSNKVLHKVQNEIFFCSFFLSKKIFLSIFLINNNFSTNLYVKNKLKACIFANIGLLLFKFSKTIKNSTLINLLFLLNFNLDISGIIFQLPLLKKKNYFNVFQKISIFKDVDLMNPFSFGNYIYNYNNNFLTPSTAYSVIFFLKKNKINNKNLICSLFGFSNIVGKPLILELMKFGATVLLFNKLTDDLSYYLKESDIVISAVGIKDFFICDFFSFGSLIFDIGINSLGTNKIYGDVNAKNLISKASFITPVPGGIGPLTVVNLLTNLIKLNFNKNF